MNFIENFDEGLIKSSLDVIEKKVDSYAKSIDQTIDSTAKMLDNKVTSSLGNSDTTNLLDPIYKFVFNLLIKPINKQAVFTDDDRSFFRIIGTFIILIITNVNTYIVDNTIGKAIDTSEKIIGYRSDGRKIGPESKPGIKIPLLMKILRTVLGGIASLLDLILMAFTNQVDVVSNIVKDFLKK